MFETATNLILTPRRRVTRLGSIVILSLLLYILHCQIDLVPHEEGDVRDIRSTIHSVLLTTPANATYPFHHVTLTSISLLVAPLSIYDPDGLLSDTFFPTHIVSHPTDKDLYFISNEVDPGEILCVRL